jgi:hypothetical protein
MIYRSFFGAAAGVGGGRGALFPTDLSGMHAHYTHAD